MKLNMVIYSSTVEKDVEITHGVPFRFSIEHKFQDYVHHADYTIRLKFFEKSSDQIDTQGKLQQRRKHYLSCLKFRSTIIDFETLDL